MRARFGWAVLSAAALALAAAAFPAAGQGEVSHEELMYKIQSARTRADHEAIASIYEKRASAELATADDHRRMANMYKSMDPTGAGRGTSAGMISHCNNLVESYTKAAKEHSALAKLHREAAAGAQ